MPSAETQQELGEEEVVLNPGNFRQNKEAQPVQISKPVFTDADKLIQNVPFPAEKFSSYILTKYINYWRRRSIKYSHWLHSF